MKKSEYEWLWVDSDEVCEWLENTPGNCECHTNEAIEEMENRLTDAIKAEYPNADVHFCNPSQVSITAARYHGSRRYRQAPTLFFFGIVWQFPCPDNG